jgi:transposase
MENEKTDYRKASANEVYAVKKTVIKQWKNDVETKEIVNNTGLCINTVRKTIRIYKKFGMKNLTPKKRGRPVGTNKTLSPEQEREIRNIIIDKTPDQIKLKCCLWDRTSVQELIQRKYGILMPIRTVGEYLRNWGFTVQKPAKMAKKQKPEEVQKWLDEEYPAIKASSVAEKAVIFWMDETAVQNECNYARGYAPKGKTPVLKIQTVKMHINMVSAINNEGKIFFKIYKDAMNGEIMKDFLNRIIIEANRKVYMICDNLKTHHSNMIRDWIAERADRLSLYFLPPYSPEYNPDEYLNHDLKQSIGTQKQADSVEDITNNTEAFMSKLSDEPEHVAAYFDHPMVKSYKD